MRKFYLSIYLLIITPFSVSAQTVNITLEPVISLSDSEKSLQKSISDYQVWKNPDLFNDLASFESFSILVKTLGIEGSDEEITFKREEIFSLDAKVSSEMRSSGMYFNSESGNASLSVFREALYFRYSESGETYFLISGKFLEGKNFESNNVISYKQSAVKATNTISCGTDFAKKVMDDPKFNSEKSVVRICRKVKIACESDDEWAAHFGFFTGFQLVQSIMGDVNSYYTAQMGINVSISGLIINDNTDSYPSGSTIDGQTLVNSFRNHWNANYSNISRNGAILFAYRDLTKNNQPIGGQTYDEFKYLCDITNAYAIIGNNNQNFYYPWITAHELGHLAGHDGHDNSTTNIMVGAPVPGPIPNSNFTTTSQNIILTKFESSLDDQCIVNDNIKLTRYGNLLQPYNVNQVCTFDWSNMNVTGSHSSMTWAFASNGTGANYSNITASSATLYHGGNSGAFTLKLSKSNECGLVERIFPFQANNCATYTYYPNETTRFLNVEFTDTKYENLPDKIYIVNENGEEILNKSSIEGIEGDEESTNCKFVFDFSSQPNGIYFLKVLFKNRKTNSTETHRILKTN